MGSTAFIRAIEGSYARLPLADADFVYVYSDFRGLGRHLAEFGNKSEFCEAMLAPLLKLGKTLIATAFTYTTEGEFHTDKTPTTLGYMNKWFLDQPGVARSEHPLFSFAALGPRADIVKRVGKSAFGHDSVHHRLQGKRCKFLHLGRPVSMGNTLIHHVEHLCGATYRLHKAYRTRVFDAGTYVGTDYSAFVRRRDVPGEAFEFTFAEAAVALREQGLINEVGEENSFTNISVYCYDAALERLSSMFYKDPTIFINTTFVQY